MQWKYNSQPIREVGVTAHLYHELCKLGIEAHLEYRFGHNRFDLVVVRDGAIVCLVEVKRFPSSVCSHEQKLSYSWLDVPLVIVYGRQYTGIGARLIASYVAGLVDLPPITEVKAGLPKPSATVAAAISPRPGLAEQRNGQTKTA